MSTSIHRRIATITRKAKKIETIYSFGGVILCRRLSNGNYKLGDTEYTPEEYSAQLDYLERRGTIIIMLTRTPVTV